MAPTTRNGYAPVATAAGGPGLDVGAASVIIARRMPREIKGHLTAGDRRFALVVSRTNEFITERLLAGALDALVRHGGDEGNLTVVRVPGAFELPLAAKKCAESGQYHAVVCLGCVIRGQTPHFEYIAGEAAKGVAQVGMVTGIPVTFGVITADTLEQAIDRAGGKAGNKGADAALSAVELLSVFAQLGGKRAPSAKR